MGITKKEVEHMAGLSRLKLTEEEKEKFSQELTSILEYIDKLNKLETKEIKPLYQTTGLKNKEEKDKIEDFKKRERILKNAPQVKDNFFEVKPIFK